MSVSLYDIYTKACKELARSIVIKSEATARAMNRQDIITEKLMIMKDGDSFYNPYDRRTWRYYLHLAGQYHPTDIFDTTFPDGTIKQTQRIMVISTDTNEFIEFTVDNLKEHRSTWRDYQKGSTYYRNLVEKYPRHRDLIDGIINPISLDKSINAEDHAILYWDANWVEANEYSLMEKIQNYVNHYFGRWDNPDYELTDDLYVPAKIGILYIYLPYIIMNLRYQLSRTIEAHSFHVWAYLGSHQHLDFYRSHLTLKQALWFYRNIRWVEHNAGKTETFKALIDIVMTERGLPIAAFDSSANYENMINDPNTFYPDTEFKRNPLNLEDIVPKEGAIKSTEEIVEDEISQARDNIDYFHSDKEKIDFDFSRTNIDNSPTKALESRVADYTKRQAIRGEDVELNTWIYMTTLGLYTARISVTNPKTADILALSQDEALIVYVYALHRMHGINPVWIPTITASNVLRRRKPTKTQVSKVVDRRYLDEEMANIYINAVDHYVPPVGKIISTERFGEFCDEVLKVKNIHRNIYSFTGDARTHIQLKVLTDQYYETVVCKLTERKMAFLDYFKQKGWLLDTMTPGEYAQLATDILKYSLGKDLVNRMGLKEIQEMMIRLLKQLSSYSIQFIRKITEEDIVVFDWGYLRYHSLGTKHRAHWYTHSACVKVNEYAARTFHKGTKALMGKFIDAHDITAKERSLDQVNLILDFDNYSHKKVFSSIRMPTVNLNHVRSWNEPIKLEPEKPVYWDESKFHVHKTTEERSHVTVGEDNELIVSGVVYVDKDYEGKQ